MKKLIMFLLSAAMLGTTAFADNLYTDITEADKCYRHIARLKDFGLISGYDDGTFKPDNYVTRAEAITMLFMARCFKEVDGAVIDYTDVPNTHWAYNYIAVLTAEGHIDGYDDGTFRPDDGVTYQEFIKMMMSLIGYGNQAKEQGGYPIGYLSIASVLDVVVSGVNMDEILTRGDAAILIDKLLDAPLCRITGYEKNEKGEYAPVYQMQNGSGKGYQTLLTEFHNIFEVTGDVDK